MSGTPSAGRAGARRGRSPLAAALPGRGTQAPLESIPALSPSRNAPRARSHGYVMATNGAAFSSPDATVPAALRDGCSAPEVPLSRRRSPPKNASCTESQGHAAEQPTTRSDEGCFVKFYEKYS